MGNESDLSQDQLQLKVLVVDDESSITQMLSMALRFDGWQVETAGTGSEAVQKAGEFAPDVMVLDIMLPDFDGMQALSRMRVAGEIAPALFLTALD